MKISLIVLSIFFASYTLATSEANADDWEGRQFNFSGIMRLLDEEEEVPQDQQPSIILPNDSLRSANPEQPFYPIDGSRILTEEEKEFDEFLIRNNGNQGVIGQGLNLPKTVSPMEFEEGELGSAADSERSRDLYKRVGDLTRMNIQSKRIKELQDEAIRMRDSQRMNLIRPERLIAFHNQIKNNVPDNNIEEEGSNTRETIAENKEKIQTEEQLVSDSSPSIPKEPLESPDSPQEGSDGPCPLIPESTPRYQLLDRKQKIEIFQKKQNSRSRLHCRSLDLQKNCKSSQAFLQENNQALPVTEKDSDSSIEGSLISCSCSLCEGEGKDAHSSSSCVDSEGLEALENANLDIEEEVASFQRIVRSRSFFKRVMKDHFSYLSNPESHIKGLQEKDAKKRWTRRKRFIKQHSGKVLCLLIAVGVIIFGFYR